MASNNFTGSTSNSYITPKILWSSTPNASTGKSDLTVTFQLCKSSSSTSSTYGTGEWVLNINNVPYSFSAKVTLPANNTYVTVYTKTVSGIEHNPDGTKSVPISVTGGISGTTYTSTTLSGNAVLDTILRASSLSVPQSINTGTSLVTTITPVNTTFRHKVQYIIDGVAKYTSNYIDAGTNTFSYTIPHSWLPSSTSKSMTVRLYTYTSNGTSAIGQKDATTTVNVPASIKPDISSFVATVGSGGLGGLYVQGKSTVKLTCTAIMGSNASVTSYVFTGPGVNTTSTNNTVTSGVITSSGVLTYKVKVTDSRGRYDEGTVSIVVYPYAEPKIISITAQRCNSSGTLTKDGTYTKVTVATTYSSINGNNTRSVVLFNSKDSTSGKPTETTVISSTNGSNTYTGVYGSGFKIDTSYTISAKITDSYTSNTLSVPLGVAQRAFNIAKYGNGVAIGGLSTVTTKDASGLFECNWDAKFTKDVNITGAESVGGNLTVTGSTTSGSIVSSGNTKTASLTVTGAETVGGNLTVTGSATAGSIVSNGNTKTATLTTTGNASIGGTLSVGGTNVSDFVVAQGTSGSWTYIKWNSGKLECYGNLSYSASCPANGGHTIITFSSKWPIEFSAMPVVNVTLGNMTVYYHTLLDVNFGTTHFGDIVICALPLVGNVVNVTGLACVRAIGHWK